MTRSLSRTIAALNDSEIAVEVLSAPHREVTVAVLDAASGAAERKSFLPDQMDKAASWLHGTAVRACPDSLYARQAEGDAGPDDERPDGEASDMMESMRQGLAGNG